MLASPLLYQNDTDAMNLKFMDYLQSARDVS